MYSQLCGGDQLSALMWITGADYGKKLQLNFLVTQELSVTFKLFQILVKSYTLLTLEGGDYCVDPALCCSCSPSIVLQGGDPYNHPILESNILPFRVLP